VKLGRCPDAERGDEGGRQRDAKEGGAKWRRRRRRCRSVERAPCEERGKERRHAERKRNAVAIEIFRRPAGVDDRRGDEGEGGEREPFSLRGDDEHAGVEQRDVTEERVAMIFPGRQEHRRRKSTDQGNDGQHERVAPNRDDTRERGHERHRAESG
jgi:hypothetical protein